MVDPRLDGWRLGKGWGSLQRRSDMSLWVWGCVCVRVGVWEIVRKGTDGRRYNVDIYIYTHTHPESGGSRNRWIFLMSSSVTPSSAAKPPCTMKMESSMVAQRGMAQKTSVKRPIMTSSYCGCVCV